MMDMAGQPNPQGFFPEYSLWNDSTFCSTVDFPPVDFSRPLFGQSIFLTPSDFDQNAVNTGMELPKQSTKITGTPWYEAYMKKNMKVVKRSDLYKDPELFNVEEEGESSSEASQSQTSEWGGRARSGRLMNNRGRKNAMQRRLARALACPARIEHSMSQGAGNEGEPVHTTLANIEYGPANFGFMTPPDLESSVPPPKRVKTAPDKETFKTNILLHILEFVKNDLQIELYFDPELKQAEWKKIQSIVSALNGDENPCDREELDNCQQYELVKHIHNRNAYIIVPHCDGDTTRQLYIYKEAPDYMYLVTPEDIRNPQPSDEEETNPFLKSITKHIKNVNENSPSLFETLVQYFMEFAKDDYTEFRFLGPFVMEEISVMNTFLGLISCLALKHRATYLNCPQELLNIFHVGNYTVDEDNNGYVVIKKVPIQTEMET